ncbi:hypothetical protein [Muricoccus vinaceus]|uniref:Uncharacterized protein n=1 Tax=Muricoccus vinaceus TaxID=424704 RepID=A0ABV6IL75_9PROT
MPRHPACYPKDDIPDGVPMPTLLAILCGGALMFAVAMLLVFLAVVLGG